MNRRRPTFVSAIVTGAIGGVTLAALFYAIHGAIRMAEYLMRAFQ